MSTEAHTGVCGKCNGEIKYAQTRWGWLWVHANGNFMASKPVWHDCNTYVVQESAK